MYLDADSKGARKEIDAKNFKERLVFLNCMPIKKIYSEGE
jgi:hypothetical protein